MTDQWTFDETRYEGHTPCPWSGQAIYEILGVFYNSGVCGFSDDLTDRYPEGVPAPDEKSIPDRELIADAPLILAECVRLQAELGKWVGRCSEMASYETKLCAEIADNHQVIERLQTIVDSLPKTADGVPVVPMTDSVWHPEWERPFTVWANGNAAPSSNTRLGSWRVDQCYSTREAAEAARKERGDARRSDT